jgi:hypothetical protein
LNIGGENRPVLPVTLGDEASLEAALAQEKGPALFDVRHRFVFSFGAELPKLADKSAALRYVLGGWQLNGIFQAQTGFPFTVTDPVLSITGFTNRPNMTCDPNEGGAKHTVTQWFNTSVLHPPSRRRHHRPLQPAPERSARPGLQPHGPLHLQELRVLEGQADPDPH